jgi:hypothetical protein
LKRLAGDGIAFRQWTEDRTLQGNRDRWRRRSSIVFPDDDAWGGGSETCSIPYYPIND